MTKDKYDATSIKILSKEEADERFGFKVVTALKEQYKHVPLQKIVILVEACILTSTPHELACKRHIEGDTTIVLPNEFEATYIELVNAYYRGS